MGMLWTMLLNLGHREPSETIVENELTCECCSTTYATTPREKVDKDKHDHGDLCGQSDEDERDR
jgi:hypothetical protein